MEFLKNRKNELEVRISQIKNDLGQLDNFVKAKIVEMQGIQGRYSEIERFEQNNQDLQDEKIKDLLIHCDNRKKELSEKFEQCKTEIMNTQQEINKLTNELEQLNGAYDELLQMEKKVSDGDLKNE